MIAGFSLAMLAGYIIALPLEQSSGILQVVDIVAEIVVIGVIEGLVIGFAQHWVLGRVLPELSRRAWAGATIVGAIVAWSAGLALANRFGAELSRLMGDSWVFSAAVIGILVGVVLSAIQWLALRRVARRAAIWVPAHAAAWTVGAIVAFAGIRGIPDGLIPALVVGSAALVGMAMGAAIAAITGLALLWVLRGEQGGKASAT